MTSAPTRVVVQAPVRNAAGVAGSGSGTGGGPGSGSGGAGGSGSGAAGEGTGAGDPGPCGEVYFSSTKTDVYGDGTVVVHVSMSVHLRDGDTMSDDLHWPFVYRTEQDNPFSQAHATGRVPLQFPPSNYDVADYQKPATAFVLKHTRPNGSTDLPDCPPR